MELPDEILTQIFDLAADEDVIFQYGLPTVMAETAWFQNALDEWALRSPQEAINIIQRRSYATKKAIMLTCRTWRRLGSEFLYRCLFFDNPSRLHLLCRILESDVNIKNESEQSSVGLGWWTKRIHLTRYYASPNRGASQDDMCNALTTIVKHCPNLSIFVVEWPMPSATFGLVADSLFKYTRKALHTVHWHVSAEAIPKIIWALDSLPLVLAAHIEFDPPTHTTEIHESLHLGSAQNVALNLPYLQQLTLRGSFSEFLEQAVDWILPGLRNLSIDCGNSRSETPDIVGFLERHGDKLKVLDINSIPPLEVPDILELCPQLEVFSFNADWRFQAPTLPATTSDGIPITDDSEPDGASRQRRRQSNTMRLSLGSYFNETSILTHTPHPRIHTIGLHGLLYAFGVGYARIFSSEEPFRSRVVRRSNDLNFGALNRAQFPQLRCIRILSRTLLNDLNKADGPVQDDEVDGMDRWERWWDRCHESNIRLEDCTGGEFGQLPLDAEEENIEEEEEEEEGDGQANDSEEYSSGGYSDEWEVEVPSIEENDDGLHTQELRQLIKECQAMAEERDESPFSGFIGPAFNLSSSMSSATGHSSAIADESTLLPRPVQLQAP
ncbi:hypothetical protein F5879DRAFT_944943 [Lentinula edodes]|uniref:uncharacterized protein n=1 Tax=Lentinula edodes TaxID=5353 RepID=UPI001E8DEB13|nr:uncharacterized protein C8R40DRAFT_1048872 [Lentinula edodes]KAH7873794.1 hypothetical protein C8R40DRAFT_1048872 [Lentinula edodes]KAJ3906697.1 hypothetical protein F5879DRAFT_944943 [Lentinula edodes]